MPPSPKRATMSPDIVAPAADGSSSFDYPERVVAFVDVLGFADLVKQSDANQLALASVRNLVTVNKLFEQFVCNFLSFADAAWFSDSLVLSMASPENHVIHLIRETGYLCRYLLLQGFLVRGAITTGSLYHSGRVVVGPALVNAYQLEKTTAVYPRVILDEATMAYWKNEFRIDEDGSRGAHPQLEPLVKRDRDAQFFLDIFNPEWADFLPWTVFVSAPNLIPGDSIEFIQEVKKRIELCRVKHLGNPKVLSKYEWLANECDQALLKQGAGRSAAP
jgi:hypothetical protein